MFHHVSVLLHEAIEALQINPKGVYVDCTLGGAGHSERIASLLDDDGLLIACDQDESAITHAKQVLQLYQNRVKIVHRNFRYITEILQNEPKAMRDGIPQVDGILFDLGVSSTQLDEAWRGFSYHQDAELDMRMDIHNTLTAKQIVNEWSVEKLTQIIFDYGEEKFARKIASNIVATRAKQPIHSTLALVEIIKQSIPAAARRTGPHPARRTFQALRIAVNDELNVLEQALKQAIYCLAPKGRLAVITFHSLEDRICKHTFKQHLAKCICPPHLPICHCHQPGELKLIHRKPIEASASELSTNMRARSAKLRIAEKLINSKGGND